MKVLETMATAKASGSAKFIYKDPFYVNNIILNVDAGGNIDAPVTSSKGTGDALKLTDNTTRQRLMVLYAEEAGGSTITLNALGDSID